MTVMLINPMTIFDSVIEQFKLDTPGLFVTDNFENVYGMIKCNEIERLCIVMGGWNYSKSKFNNISAHDATKEIHKINPLLPILMWNNGFNNELNFDKKEIHLDSSSIGDAFFSITKKFYEADLTRADIPV